MKFQEIIIAFIVGQLSTNQDLIDIHRAFDVLDRDHDGKINKQDLYYGYRKMYGENTHVIVDQIYNRIDVDNSGQIDSTEWVIATIDK